MVKWRICVAEDEAQFTKNSCSSFVEDLYCLIKLFFWQISGIKFDIDIATINRIAIDIIARFINENKDLAIV